MPSAAVVAGKTPNTKEEGFTPPKFASSRAPATKKDGGRGRDQREDGGVVGREKMKVNGERGKAGVWMREGRLGFGCEEVRRKFFVYVYFFYNCICVFFSIFILLP